MKGIIRFMLYLRRVEKRMYIYMDFYFLTPSIYFLSITCKFEKYIILLVRCNIKKNKRFTYSARGRRVIVLIVHNEFLNLVPKIPFLQLTIKPQITLFKVQEQHGNPAMLQVLVNVTNKPSPTQI